jgi:DNA-directed RNA polymerase specialized sigma24 family protein
VAQARRPRDRERRAVRGGQGAAGRLLPRRVRERGTGDRDRLADPGGRARPGPHRAAARHGPQRVRDVSGASRARGAPARPRARRSSGSSSGRYGDFESCEDALQEALLAAATHWPAEGVPDNPTGWLITVASRRWTEQWRSETARRRREERAVALAPRDPEPVPDADDTLTLLLLCCHPALSAPSQVALTLRAVGGLSTAEIGRALLVPRRRSPSGSAAPSSASRPRGRTSRCRRPGSSARASAPCCTCST